MPSSSLKSKVHHENWPTPVFYAPLFFYYLYNSLKFRSLSYFTAANPALKTGGLCGFSKYESFELLPAKYIPETVLLKAKNYTKDELTKLMTEKTMTFPVILKPDQGERGFLVSKVETVEDLYSRLYSKSSEIDFLIQEFVEGPLELGVFLIRKNGNWKISSITSKNFLSVKGDGSSSLVELIAKDKRASTYFEKGESTGLDLQSIPFMGEEILLEPIGNHCLGTEFINECDKISDKLESVFHRALKDVEGVNYCRLDLRTPSWKSLELGEFKLMELNGVSAEPSHIYDPNTSLSKAYRDLFSHWNMMGQVVSEQISKGQPSERVMDTISLVRKHMRKKTQLNRYNKPLVKILGCNSLDLNKDPEAILSSFDIRSLIEGHECDPSSPVCERVVLFADKDYEVVFRHWKTGEKTPVHSHPNKECWFKCIKGEVVELRDMGQKQSCVCAGDFAHINDSMGAHQMLNMTDTCSYSIHLYKNISKD